MQRVKPSAWVIRCVVIALALVVAMFPATSTVVGAQEVSPSTVPVPDVAGEGTVSVEVSDEPDPAERQLRLVIVALLVLAGVIAVGTLIFFFATRPSRPGAAEGDDAEYELEDAADAALWDANGEHVVEELGDAAVDDGVIELPEPITVSRRLPREFIVGAPPAGYRAPTWSDEIPDGVGAEQP